MISEQIDKIAQGYADAYGQYLMALTGVVANAIADRNAMTPKIASELALNSYHVAGVMFEHIQDIHQKGGEILAQSIANAGVLSDENYDLIHSHCEQSWVGCIDALAKTITSDTTAAREAFRRFVFDASLKASRMGEVGGLIAARMKHTPVKIAFMRQDRANRNWASVNHVKTLVRSALVSTYADAFTFTLAANGIDQARVVYDSPDHTNHGMVFSISGNDLVVPSYEEIRTLIFHPNATARLEPVRS